MTTQDTPTTLAAARAGRLFRAVAIAEACSWAGLLLGMLFKYVVVGTEIGVQLFGPIHGALFVAYIAVTAWAARALRWPVPALVAALLCSIPPLATLWFERRARRTGRLPTGRDAVPAA
jgi:integral membrane protein